jgi:alginate O-acetyltransferase complex protein AlgI
LGVTFVDADFLFLFFPLVLAITLMAPKGARNSILLVASLLFYALGESSFVIVMIEFIVLNYFFGLAIEATRDVRRRELILGLAVSSNLLALFYFKYLNFAIGTLSPVLARVGVNVGTWKSSLLPAGISFYTFHSLSYLVDVYRRNVRAIRNPLDFGLYISFFPQLIAGPIVRYKFIAPQLHDREIRSGDFAEGARRFIVGLGKKLLIADTVAVIADRAFGAAPQDLSAGLAWCGLLCYALQIYYDFSGYSDMAIGMARMFGFRFPENFRYPYISQSISEFWHRWHISLSTWFRDYLYIPLGGNRVSRARVYFNLIVVFLLCGVWHGANWTFVVWGLWHGMFLIFERAGLARWLKDRHRLIRHAYALSAICFGWVLFRAPDFNASWIYFKALSGFGVGMTDPIFHIGRDVGLAIVFGVLFSLPLVRAVHAGWLRQARRADIFGETNYVLGRLASAALLSLVFALSMLCVAAATHHPFIYFRF